MTREDLITRIRNLAQKSLQKVQKVEDTVVEYDEITNFPELKKVIVDLLSTDFDNFLSSIDWVAPRPTTFRINLKNDQNFYLIYDRDSWTAQVEGKKYYLKNLPEEQKAAQSISRILRYGKREEVVDDFADEEIDDIAPNDTTDGDDIESTPPEDNEDV